MARLGREKEPDVNAAVRVLVVDDDPLVRAGLTMVIGGSPDITVVARPATEAK